MKHLWILLILFAVPHAWASEKTKVEINVPESGTVTKEEGLEAWQKIFEVVSHPRCSNCHVGEDNKPMWSGPSYGKTRPHGMNINGGENRMGVGTMTCNTCHGQTKTANNAPHMAPQVNTIWRLAPVEAAWFGKTTDEICQQLRDPERNGDRSFVDIATHLEHDVILHWAWNPGGGREPAPHSLQEHVNDILAWGVAGMPCPNDSKK